MADIPISDFNQAFATELDDSEYETMAGWVSGCLGRVPRRGDRAEIDGLDIDVIRADARRAQWLRVTRRAHPDTSNQALEK
jgi:magnesium and cobalt transporter